MDTSEVLDRAADLIEERGWVKGPGGWDGFWGGEENAPLCLEGGIMAALGIENAQRSLMYVGCPAYDAVARHVGFPTAPYASEPFGMADVLWLWNDDTCRTAEEVIAVLRAAAVIESAREAQDRVWESYAELVTA